MDSLKEKVYKVLKQRIIDAEYNANEFLSENVLAEELQTSRTPIREAAIALEREGYVKILPKRGIMVMPFTIDDVCAIFEIREALEPWLIKAYATKISREELLHERQLIFDEIETEGYCLPTLSMNHRPHNLFLRQCQNYYLKHVISDVESLSKRKPSSEPQRVDLQLVEWYSSSERAKLILEKHILLIDLILEGKIDEAANEMLEHVRLARSEFIKYWFG